MNIDSSLKEKSGIYKIQGNGVDYIGSSCNLFRRLSDHFRFLKKNIHSNRHIQNVYNKHGIEKFSYEIIEFCPIEDLKRREDFYMDLFNVFYEGFNQSRNSISPLGYKHTEKSKQIMSLKKLGHIQSKEQIEKKRKSLLGKVRTKSHKDNYRESKLGDKNPMFGRKENPKKTKERMKNLFLSKQHPYKLVNLDTGEEWLGSSIKDLGENSPLSRFTIMRLKFNKAGIKTTKKYNLIW